MAEFIPPKNEVPEPKVTERAISSVSGVWNVGQLSGVRQPEAVTPLASTVSGQRPVAVMPVVDDVRRHYRAPS